MTEPVPDQSDTDRRVIDQWECEVCREPSYLHDGFGQQWRCGDHGPVRMLRVRYAEVAVLGPCDPDEDSPAFDEQRHSPTGDSAT